MILYRLACANDHEFEAWFRDGTTYDRQSSQGDINCPLCGNARVSKAPMAPNLAKGRSRGELSGKQAKDAAREFLQAAEQLRRHVDGHCEFVGDRFAEEARRIHFGETEERDIYGEASDQDASELLEEGVEFYRIPFMPRRDD